MNKDLMVLEPLKKTLTLHFARVCLYCSLRPLMYGVLGSGCLVGYCEGDPFLLQGIQV